MIVKFYISDSKFITFTLRLLRFLSPQLLQLLLITSDTLTFILYN